MTNDTETRVAANAEKRGEGICRTCLHPIWCEVGTVGRQERDGWSDRNERGGDSLVCFKAIHYRHVPLEGREAAIYDGAARAAREDVADRIRQARADMLEQVATCAMNEDGTEWPFNGLDEMVRYLRRFAAAIRGEGDHAEVSR